MEKAGPAALKVFLLVVAVIIVVSYPVLPSVAFFNPELWRELLLLAVAATAAAAMLIFAAFGARFTLRTSLLTVGLLAWALANVIAAVASPTVIKSLTTPT